QWQPWGFHLVNLLAHAATSAVVTLLMLAAGVPGAAALVAGAWFAVMPAHVESVAWISGRTDVLAGLFLALALLLDRRRRRAGWTTLPHYVAMLWPWYPHSPDLALKLPGGAGAPSVIAGGAITLGLVALAGWLVARRRPAALPLTVFVLPLLVPAGLAWFSAN